jgi:hypothetical protein
MAEEKSAVGEMVSNSGCAAVSGCLWLVSAVFLAPVIRIGFSYGYSLPEWLSMIPFPAEREEVLPWFIRIVLLLVFVGSTLLLAAFALSGGAYEVRSVEEVAGDPPER